MCYDVRIKDKKMATKKEKEELLEKLKFNQKVNIGVLIIAAICFIGFFFEEKYDPLSTLTGKIMALAGWGVVHILNSRFIEHLESTIRKPKPKVKK